MGLKTAPYGTWVSPITAEAVTKDSMGLPDNIVDSSSGTIYYLASRPSEGGRNILVRTDTDRDVAGRDWNMRTGVNEYGGGAAVVRDGVVYFSHFVDGRVYRVKEGEGPEPITPESGIHRFANFDIHPTHPNILVSILEDHTVDLPSAIVTTLCIINTTTKSISPLVSGADFYASPKFSPDGTRLAWQQWFHPDMPWEGAEIVVANISISTDETITVGEPTHVAGEKKNISVSYPSWANNATLLFTSDVSGYQNPWKYSNGVAAPVLPEPIAQDFSDPPWRLGTSPYAVIDKAGKSAVFAAHKNGRSLLYLVDLEGHSIPQELESPYVDIHNIRQVSSDRLEFVFTGITATDSSCVVLCTLSSAISPSTPTYRVLKSTSSAGTKFPLGLISPPSPMSLTITPEESLHIVYYAPTNPEYSGTSVEGEKPPCVVYTHGGPTGMAAQGLDWNKQYFTSRGWAWIDVNYGGSSGYGRKYISRLAGQWGVVDVQDSIRAALALSNPPYDLVDPSRMVIRGGSAGGFTTLAALSTAPNVTVFAAGTSSYGISSLVKLTEFTHKFELRYMEKLVGGTYGEIPDVYIARSPITHADKIVAPLLILQGELDRVVPKEQSEEIVEAVKARGGIVEYKLYPGEGHGFRQEKNMKDALERELGFYEKVLKLRS